MLDTAADGGRVARKGTVGHPQGAEGVHAAAGGRRIVRDGATGDQNPSEVVPNAAAGIIGDIPGDDTVVDCHPALVVPYRAALVARIARKANPVQRERAVTAEERAPRASGAMPNRHVLDGGRPRFEVIQGRGDMPVDLEDAADPGSRSRGRL